MLKRSLIIIAFLFLIITVCVHSGELFLSYYVLFPMLLFPLFFFWEDPNRLIFWAATASVCAVYFIFWFFHPFSEMLLFGLANLALFAGVVFYRHQWKIVFAKETVLCDHSLKELEGLKQKHQSRLESLHHLEKQVAGLLDLFEIARDFNDSMSFEGMMSILQQKVLPELAFRQFWMILFEKKQEPGESGYFFTVNQQGVQRHQNLEELPPRGHQLLNKARALKPLTKEEGGEIVFPLIADGEMKACLILEGTQPNDLAKFEVLAAYMTLQIKKVFLYETVKELSIRDGLTGVFVRRHFLQRFEEELKRSVKYELPLAVLMLDIDHFKRYNDQYGHLAGDATLKQVANLLCENLRKVDIVARYGGEEFVVVIPETKGARAIEVAERIRSNIARYNFKVYNDQARVTVSVGIAAFPEDIPQEHRTQEPSWQVTELIRLADQALYRAKEEGRNRVVWCQNR